MELQLAAAYWSLGMLSSAQLPEIATQALVAGHDTRSLRILAGETDPIMAEAGPLFVKSLEELGIDIPSPLDAAVKLIRLEAQKIVTGACTPYEGAEHISVVVHRLSGEDFDLMFNMTARFIGAESELVGYVLPQGRALYGEEECQAVREFYEPIIIGEAKKLLDADF